MHVVPKQVELNPSQICFFFPVTNQEVDFDIKKFQAEDSNSYDEGKRPEVLHSRFQEYEVSLFLAQLLDTE